MSGRHAAERVETGDPLANDLGRFIVELNAVGQQMGDRPVKAGPTAQAIAARLVTLLDRHVRRD